MAYFLIVYDRQLGDLISMKEYEESRSALADRFAREREFDDPNRIEVVVLAAASRDELKRTHARYFQSAADLVGRMREGDRAASAKKPKRWEMKRAAGGFAGR